MLHISRTSDDATLAQGGHFIRGESELSEDRLGVLSMRRGRGGDLGPVLGPGRRAHRNARPRPESGEAVRPLKHGTAVELRVGESLVQRPHPGCGQARFDEQRLLLAGGAGEQEGLEDGPMPLAARLDVPRPQSARFLRQIVATEGAPQAFVLAGGVHAEHE